ncbi:MAG: phosphatase [Anaeroplasmataceae bacterium]
MYGIIDIGSNTIHLKIYRNEKNKLVELVDKKEFAKLVSYVHDGILSEEGISKCIRILIEFKETLKLFNIKEYYVVATASFRNINNTNEVLSRITSETGLDITVLSGEDEGLFDYYGVRLKDNVTNGIIVDIGGGSTEIVIVKDSDPIKRYSIPFGSLNSYTDYNIKKFPSKTNAKQIKNIIKNELKKYEELDFVLERIVGVGGTLRALKKLLNTKDEVVSLEDIEKILDLSRHDKRVYEALILNTIPDRIYTITPGLIIIRTIMKFYNIKELSINSYGIREGYLDYIIRNKVM